MYDIRKGWPAEAAIDEVLTAANNQTVAEGMIVTVADGKATPANFTAQAAASDPMAAFLIGHEKVRGTFTGLMSQCIIEVDAEHYEAGSYAPGDVLTAKNGKFAPAGNSKVLARVLKFDAASGLMRLMWHEAR
jgi:hypothetical protein